MKTRPTTEDERIEKLPMWAQDLIAETERQRLEAVRTLEELLDNQTPTKFYARDIISVKPGKPEHKTFYFATSRVTCENDNVFVEIYPCDEGVQVKFWSGKQWAGGAAIIPEASNSIRVVQCER
jgi:hypothetical protein